jgi:hypothetical protein
LFRPETTTTGADGSAEATAGQSAAAVRHAPDAATNAATRRRAELERDNKKPSRWDISRPCAGQ